MTSSPKKRSLIFRIFNNYIRNYIGSLFVAVFFMLIAAAMTAGFAKLVQPVLDDVLTAKNQDLVFPVASMMAAVFVIRGVSTYIHTVVMSRIGEWIIGDLQKELFARFIYQDLSFHQNYTSSELLSRVMNDVQMVRNAVTDTLTGFGKSLITLVFLAGVMFWQDWKLAIAAFTIFPLAVAFVAWIGQRLRKLSKRLQEEMGSLTETLSQILQGIRLVKAYGREEDERARAEKNIVKVRSLIVKSVRIGNLSTPVNEILVGLTVFGIILYGGYQVANDQMTPGILLSFIAAFTLAYEPMKKLARLNNTLQMGLGAAERVFEMIDTPVNIRHQENREEVSLESADINFENVDFYYEDDAKAKVLESLSFTAQQGQVTALVGASGAGKSTIINLLLRFYDVKNGSIMINDKDIRNMDLKNLRAQMAIVAQDVTIFNESVSQNIAYGRTEASEEEVIEAAKLASAHDFISNLPEGYNTVLGEDGTKLSGGQRQRIAIARAILRDAPILLLDEATSALDNEAETAIQNALSKFQKGRTTLVIAHRLSTVQNADQILVMDKGQIIEKGTHKSLLENEGVYAHMVALMKRDEIT